MMLGAVMFGHRQMQTVIDGIIRLAERAAKEPREIPVRRHQGHHREGQASRRRRTRRRIPNPGKAAASHAHRRDQGEDGRRIRRAKASSTSRNSARFGTRLEAQVMRNAVLDTRTRIDGRDLVDRAADHCRSRCPAAHPRLGAVYPRRDAGLCRRHARHRRGRAIRRQPGRHLQAAFHAALQLPSLFRRRNRPHVGPGPSRNRPWQASLARGASDAAEEGRLPLHAARACRKSPSPTAPPRWPPSAALRSR